MIMSNEILIIGTIFFMINLTAYLIMLLDKNRARVSSHERISEGVLFFMASALGSFGVFAGMFSFHHKTQKWYFIIGIPLLMIQNSALIYLLYLNFAKYF